MIDYNGNMSRDYLKDKYVFWDIDGVLAPYRFNNHIGDPDGSNNGMSLCEIDENCFLYRKPIRRMQLLISHLAVKGNIICSHCQVQKELDDKMLWLDKYYPTIEYRILIFEDTPKHIAIRQWCKAHDISMQDVVFVDDTLSILREAERNGIESWHISSLIDMLD